MIIAMKFLYFGNDKLRADKVNLIEIYASICALFFYFYNMKRVCN